MLDTSAFQLFLLALVGWLDRRERDALAYLMEENRVLRRQLGGDAFASQTTTGANLRRGHSGWADVPSARSPHSSHRTRCCAGIVSSSMTAKSRPKPIPGYISFTPLGSWLRHIRSTVSGDRIRTSGGDMPPAADVAAVITGGQNPFAANRTPMSPWKSLLGAYRYGTEPSRQTACFRQWSDGSHWHPSRKRSTAESYW